ncbi:hypothetical protein N7453_001258 [Penicillium expansum]|nr:hypothetical protein N7453_001258 [Penicillium expansum]
MNSPEYFISWGSERHVPLRRFETLQSARRDLIRYYREVFETAQTFTQHFSKQPLNSYEMERSLRKNMGCGPSCLDEDASSTSICWLDIVRHGEFQQQSDGCYHCYIQGKVFVHDEQLHNRVDFCRSHALHISNSGPSDADIERESKATLDIFTDISNELSDISNYKKGLVDLQREVGIRHSAVQLLRRPVIISPKPTNSPQYLTPLEPDTAGPIGRTRASIPAEAGASSDSSGSENGSDDDRDEDSSEDESGDEDAEEDGPEDKGLHDKGTEDGSSKNDTSQQSNNNSDNGGNAPPDDAIVVPPSLLFSRTPSSMSLIAEEENFISTGHASLPGENGNAISVNNAPSNDSSRTSSLTVNENDTPMDHVSLKEGPQVDTHLSPQKGPKRGGRNTLKSKGPKRDGRNTLKSKGPSRRAAKRRRLSDVSETQEELPETGRKSTSQERSIGVAWMKANLHRGWSGKALAEEYFIEFGRTRQYGTLKSWMDKDKAQAESYIVVLKVPIPFLQEALLNDDSS